MAVRACHGIKGETEIKIKCIPSVRFVVDSDRESKHFDVIQGNANETSLKLMFWYHIV